MKRHTVIICCLMLLVPLSATPVQAKHAPQARNTASIANSCREFVQGFYDWYAPIAVGQNSGPAWQAALNERGADFSKKLSDALKVDLAAQAKSGADIVGLDFDPILNTQDPAAHYEAGSGLGKGPTCSVNVYAVEAGTRATVASVKAVLENKGGHWQFTNFRYPGVGDLSSILVALKKVAEKRTN